MTPLHDVLAACFCLLARPCNQSPHFRVHFASAASCASATSTTLRDLFLEPTSTGRALSVFLFHTALLNIWPSFYYTTKSSITNQPLCPTVRYSTTKRESGRNCVHESSRIKAFFFFRSWIVSWRSWRKRLRNSVQWTTYETLFFTTYETPPTPVVIFDRLASRVLLVNDTCLSLVSDTLLRFLDNSVPVNNMILVMKTTFSILA